MNKNKLIKQFLEHNINNSLRLFREQFSFPNLLRQELNNFEKVNWISSPEVDEMKEERKSELIELLNDKHLHAELEALIGKLVETRRKDIQEHIEHQFIANLSNISQQLPTEKKAFKLNLLFLEHDYEPESCFCGYDDASYEFKLLTGQEYLNYDYSRVLFNGAGKFDYTPFLSPLLEFEEIIGEEKVEMIDEALSMGAYLGEIKKLFVLNGYLGIHLCLENITDKVRGINMPMREEVFVFGNEHDCEQLNIYVL